MPFSYLFPRGIKWQRKSAAGFSPHRVGDADKGDILFLEREYPPYTPKRKDEGPSPLTPHIGSFWNKNCTRCAIGRGVHGFAMNLLRVVSVCNRALLP